DYLDRARGRVALDLGDKGGFAVHRRRDGDVAGLREHERALGGAAEGSVCVIRGNAVRAENVRVEVPARARVFGRVRNAGLTALLSALLAQFEARALAAQLLGIVIERRAADQLIGFFSLMSGHGDISGPASESALIREKDIGFGAGIGVEVPKLE